MSKPNNEMIIHLTFMRHVVNQFIIKYLLLNFLLALHHSHDMSNFINNCLARGFEIEFVKVYFGRIPPFTYLKYPRQVLICRLGVSKASHTSSVRELP